MLSKYSMLGRFYAMHDALDFLESGIVAAMGESASAEKLGQLETVVDYMRSVLLHTPFAETVSITRYWTTIYDLEKWRSEGYAKHLQDYTYPEERTFAAIVEAEPKALIQNRIATFGEHPSGLGKFTRTMFARDLRRVLVSQTVNAPVSVGV